ncbi:MAG: nicotinate-nucleotide pyrophosphorylase (carboxylating) [Saprospiraceae bacterium]|jgi:nicotinate-nucleotide pyrophosphorylase (carboxylating)
MNNLDQQKLSQFIKDALHEDVQDGDHTSLACIPSQQTSRAKLLVKDKGIIAGVEIARQIFQYLDPGATLEVLLDDGTEVKYGDISFYLTCNSQALLKGERLALNTMQRLSGVATLSRAFYNEVKGHPVTILDTRKTTPLLRFLEKWAVVVGGCSNYRDGLYDRIMLKDNHIDAAGSITKAVESVLSYLGEKDKNLDMTVEVRGFKELKEVLALNAHPRVMLDNFSTEQMIEAVMLVNHALEVEASGGIKLNNVREIAATGVDFISIGALTHSAQSLDLSLKIIK